MGMMDFLHRFRRHTFAHGVHPADFKAQTRDRPIQRLPFAPELILPVSQHAGAPAVPCVKPGQEVVRGEPIATAHGHMSVPLHAPATGMIRAIQLMPTARGPKTQAIVLHVYAGSNQEVLYGGTRDIDAMTPEEIVQAVQDSGMVGLGGAAFPTHVKLTPPAEHQVDILVINGCECEPYLTCDHRLMLEQTADLIRGTRIVMRALRVQRAVIGVEDNKPDAVAAIAAMLPADESIRVEPVQTKYPQGAEKMLVASLLGRNIPPGALPSAVGVSILNVGTVTGIGELLPKGQGVIERVVTLNGAGVRRPGNYRVPVGTPVRFLLDYAGANTGTHELILGGPMMGMSVATLDVPVTKGVSGMVVLEPGDPDLQARPQQPCIHCGYCVEACPMHLNPSMLGQLAMRGDYATMQDDFHLRDCFECGCCSYVCPANIPLVQYFRIAKSINRERAA